ncbi:E3 ubiquitin-protein ligase listerin [Diabrotica virgifera virgifera]|uniref:E3 ubiquitin-protein ligase listerin n=1 Tax=Diabrotica virgifera virgifera TaxID=50390 RepID=A0ABM5KLE3_DIAVI|nr:E3 ubiquitin-protein ligase listerin [Diabrotica virgifera virgifera]
MGGKHKVANRTKNNARPSNSGRSAELLGTSIPQFAGFSGIKDTPFGFSCSTDEIDTSLDPNTQVIFKKISKKDSTTKIKGLQELAALIKESDHDTVKTLLPMWPRFYSVLVTDTDNRVREATHNVHHQIILKVKRNIAPYLKQLMAPWFTSQYDTYAPAASAASQSFTDAFPPNKIQEAIVFCQEEILNYLSDNLLVQTAQTLSNLKHVSVEEAEAKYERVLISCLQGYCLYLEKVSTEQIRNTSELNNIIISNAKFWKFSKSKVAHVRASFFNIISVICQKATFLFDDKGSQVVNSVFVGLDEYDPTVLPKIWEATLLTMSNIKDWWTYINIEKLFLPKLWKILKQGGQGNASIIYPSLLPLISHLPQTIDDNAPQFYNLFFENLWLGLNQKSTVSSRSESVAVATAFVECLQYVILKRQSDLPFCKTLIKAHLVNSIEWCLIEDQVNYKTLFNQISTLVQHWSRNLDSEYLNVCLEFFLENVRDVFRDTLFNVKELPAHSVEKVADKQLDLLQSLKVTHKSKKQFKVKFSSEETDNQDSKQKHSKTTSDDKMYYTHLNKLVYDICEDYVKYISEKKSRILVKHLYSLVIDFDTKNFFSNLNEKMKQKVPDSKPIDVYTKILHMWLVSPELCCKHVVSLIFLMFEYLESTEKQQILNTFSKITSEECLSWCISEALSHPYNKDELVKKWLRTEKISKFIVSITDKIIVDECPPDLSTLFKVALTENQDSELFICDSAVAEIISKLVSVVENYSDHVVTADTCTSLAAYICAIIYTDNLLLTYSDQLLLALFRLSCNSNIDNEIISTETIYELTSAWQDAVTLLCKNMSKEDSLTLVSKLAVVVEEEFLKSNLDEANVNYLINVVVNTLRAVYKSLPLHLTVFLMVFVERKFINSSKSYIEDLCKVAKYISGELSNPREEIKSSSSAIDKIDIARYFTWIYFKLGIVASTLKDILPDEYDDEDEDEDKEDTSGGDIEKPSIILKVVDRPEKYVAQILHDLCVCQVYIETFKNTLYFDSIVHFYVLTEMKMKTTLTNTDKSFRSNLKRIIKENSRNYGWQWPAVAYLLYSELLPEDLKAVYKEFVQDTSKTDVSYELHLTQTFSQNINYDLVHNKADAIDNIVSLRSLIQCEDIDVQIAEVFTQMEAIRSKNVPHFLYNTRDISWQDCQEIVEVIRLCAAMMEHKFNTFSQRHWDFAVLSLVSWATNCLKFKDSYDSLQYQAILCSVVSLYVNTDNKIKELKQKDVSSSFVDEWQDVLVESIHSDLLQTWLYLADKLKDKKDIMKYIPLIQELSKLLDNINCDTIFKLSESELPKWTKFLKQGCVLLVNSQPNLQSWGYKMLLVLVPGLVKIDNEAVITNTPHQNGLIFEQFKEKLVETHEIINSMLMGFKLGEDSCRVEPMTDSYTYTLAYLLLWDVLLTLCDSASTELRFQYADWLRNENLLNTFLNNLFKLMPTEVLHYGEGKSKCIMDHFVKKPQMCAKDACDSEKIEQLVCWLYSSALAQLPALVRQWWTTLDSKLAQVVEKVTQIYVSPRLITQELNDVMTYQSKFKNMVLKVSHVAREITAIYTVDEIQEDLVISLPQNYPLGGLTLQCKKQIAGSSIKQWLLQFKKCVIHQNGKIWNGLSLWNNNLEKKFDGVEECYICFAVLHQGTYQLPKLSCQTCKKKFHSACLYKWFRTSYKSSCPICRNLF